MKAYDIEAYRNKAMQAYYGLKRLLQEDSLEDDQAKALYYFLMKDLINRNLNNKNINDFAIVYNKLHKDSVYIGGSKVVSKIDNKDKIQHIAWNTLNAQTYKYIYYIYKKVFEAAK
jgi:hypothetical protein